jgi:uncharacterized protein (DUF488 family)
VTATIYTVGHGTKPIEEFIQVLVSVGIQRLVDVRRYPGSRRNPQFSRPALERSLPDAGIAYDWWGETLGGRREDLNPNTRHTSLRNKSFQDYADYMDTKDFRAAVTELEERSAGERVAIMCAETLWWKCHRRMISDALHVRDNEVLHVIKPNETNAHKPIEEMRVGEDGWPVYDLGPLTLLD